MREKRCCWLIVVLLVVCSVVLNAANQKTAVFQGTTDEVFNAAVKVAQVNWVISFMDRPTLTFSFPVPPTFASNGLLCGVSMEKESDGVHVTMHLQCGASHRADKVAAQFFKDVQDELAKLAKQKH